MKICISGYVLEENRHSMVRTAQSIHRHLLPLLPEGDSVVLDQRGNAPLGAAFNYVSLTVKLRKRLLMPARWWCQSCDILHIVDNDYAFGIPPWKLNRTVVTCHDMMPLLLHGTIEDAFPGTMGRFCYERVLKNLARCARVVCDSEFTKQCVIKHTDCQEQRLQVIPLAVDDFLKPIKEDRAELDAFCRDHDLSGKRVLLHVGSCAPYKNIETLLRIFKKLTGTVGDDLVLLKVGGQFSEAQVTLIADLDLDPHIRHVTGLSEDGLRLAYNAADLLLWPSHFEGFGLPIVEAMACGTPVVCSNGGSLPEVAGDAASVHDPNDEEALVTSCLKILDDKEHALQMRHAGLAYAARFTWEATAKAYYEVFHEVAGLRI